MLYKRNHTWWVRFTTPSGQRIRRSTGTRDAVAAREFLDRSKAEYWRVERFGEQKRRLWQEAVVRWLEETSHKKTHDKDKERLRYVHAFLSGKYLDEIDYDTIEVLANAKAAEGAKPATVNRHLAVVRAILRKARDEWHWVGQIPKVRMRKEPRKRVRFLTQDEAMRLMEALPPHLEDMARFALATGLRMSNVTQLRWSEVHLTNAMAWVHADESKSGNAIPVPLNTDACAILAKLVGNHAVWVFTYRGKPIKRSSSSAWYRALKRAGIKNFRWHDLRHTWASWHAQAGTPLSVLQELGGWATPQMVNRYAHLSVEHLKPYAQSIAGTNLAHTSDDVKNDDL